MNKKRILIVDDEKDFTKLVKLNLEATGKYEVRTENRGMRALAAAMSFNPGLILLDIMMPDADGGDIAIQIRKSDRCKNIPIAFLTATVTEEEIDARDNIPHGFSFIPKPVNTDELIDFIERNIRK